MEAFKYCSNEKAKERGQRYLRVLSILAVLTLMISALVSCGKDSSPPGRKAGQAGNPYSTDSVFLETRKRLRENPGDADAWYHLADLYDRNGQYTEAIEAYKKVTELKTGTGYVYFKIGTAYDRLNKPAEAVGAFKKAIKYMPGHAPAYNNLGVAYGRLGRTDEEIGVLKKAIKLRPGYAAARYNLGFAYIKTGNKKAALQQYEALKDIDSGIAGALMKEIKGGP